jgi:hypothetical protein
MLKIHVSIGVVIFLTGALQCYGQERNEAETVVDEKSSGSPPVTVRLPKDITLESSAGVVVLPHDVHVRDKKLKCARCHHQIHAEDLDTPHAEYLESSLVNCQICHNTNPENSNKYYKCSLCHPSEPADISDETLSSKVVIHKSCWECHDAGTGVEASRGCSNCHTKNE